MILLEVADEADVLEADAVVADDDDDDDDDENGGRVAEDALKLARSDNEGSLPSLPERGEASPFGAGRWKSALEERGDDELLRFSSSLLLGLLGL